VQGDPGAILVIEFQKETREEILAITQQVEAEMRAAGLGYHFPVLFGADTKKIWTLRKAGLGLLSNLPGDEKAVPVIEDTAVDVEDLPAYIAEFNEILKKHGLYAVHYAHAGSGELHLRPIINLKTEEGNRLFRVIAEEVATLVKKYKGSLSGEHGDGRLRGEFIQQMVGEKNYRLLKEVKNVWDPQHIFNPNKIVDTPPMNSMLRYVPGQFTPAFKTIFRFHQQDILQHAEQCNGSGDCRKSHLSGGTMCPSYMATRNEKDTTRARANILREFLTNSDKHNRYDHKEIYEVMSLCLSCKACKSECPSNVDMAKLKAMPSFDLAGAALRLDDAINAVDTLPLVSSAQPLEAEQAAQAPHTVAKPSKNAKAHAASAPVASTPPNAGWSAGVRAWWGRLWNDVRGELGQIVQVRRVDQTEALLLSSDQAWFLRENLKLRLMNARLALLSRNEAVFRADLGRADTLLARYFDTQSSRVTTVQNQLSQARATVGTLQVPTLADSLAAVRGSGKE
jgi:ferredoxin